LAIVVCLLVIQGLCFKEADLSVAPTKVYAVTCERCLQEDESAIHILCDCEAIAHLRFRHLGQFFMEPSDFYDAPIFRVYISSRV
jgi:hypothetical protein